MKIFQLGKFLEKEENTLKILRAPSSKFIELCRRRWFGLYSACSLAVPTFQMSDGLNTDKILMLGTSRLSFCLVSNQIIQFWPGGLNRCNEVQLRRFCKTTMRKKSFTLKFKFPSYKKILSQLLDSPLRQKRQAFLSPNSMFSVRN